MRAAVHTRYGSPDVLEIRDVPRPVVAPDGVLVRVHFAALNALDWHVMRGQPYVVRLEMGLRRPRKQIPGVDIAGVVEAIGQDVTEFRPGDEVFANKARGAAEYVAGPVRLFAHRPTNVSLEEAAAIPAAGLTALQALRDRAGVRKGQRVLINGASGGVGTFSVQIARWLGADVTAVTSTGNVELVRSLGAQHVIDYTTTDVTRSGERFDVVLDNVGSPSIRALRRVLTPQGTLVLVGAPPGRVIAPLLRVAAARLLERTTSQRLRGFLAEPVKEDLLTLKALVESGGIRPVIDRRYQLAEIREAMRYLETMHARGKIVLAV